MVVNSIDLAQVFFYLILAGFLYRLLTIGLELLKVS